jgi:hypothetical protein
MRYRKSVTVDQLRELIKTKEATDNDFFVCFEDITDTLDWTVFADDWVKIFEAAIGLQPGEIESNSIYDWLISAAAADGFNRGIQSAAEALGVKKSSLDVVLSYWHEEGFKDRPEPGFENVKVAILDYEQWMEKKSNE